jgi:predicted  nucleic acid-binding Zn-ribbon protein
MFHCERCGIRFSTGALSGRMDCPRCKSRDGVNVMLTWEPMLAARTAAALDAARQSRPEARQSPRSTSISPNFSASSRAS